MGSNPSSLLRYVHHLIATAAAALVAAAPAPATPPDDEPAAPFRFGLEAALRFEGARRFAVEDCAPSDEPHQRRALYRVRPLAVLQPAERWEVIVQPQLYGARGAGEYSIGSLYRAGAVWSGERVRVAAGRQEFAFGSAFLLGADSFYDGLAYDGARTTVEAGRGVTVDLFGGRYVPSLSGGVSGSVGGAWVAWTGPARTRFETYGVLDRGAAGNESVATLSFGARAIVPLRGGATLEVEPVVQRGRFGSAGQPQRPVKAWGGHLDLTIPAGRWELGASLAAGSPETDPEDGIWREFRNPSHDTYQLGDLGLVGDLSGLSVGTARASGLRTLTVSATAPLRQTSLAVDLHLVRAGRVYGATSRDVGAELDAALGVPLAEGVALTIAATHFRGGEFFAESGSARSFTYGFLGLDLAF